MTVVELVEDVLARRPPAAEVVAEYGKLFQTPLSLKDQLVCSMFFMFALRDNTSREYIAGVLSAFASNSAVPFYPRAWLERESLEDRHARFQWMERRVQRYGRATTPEARLELWEKVQTFPWLTPSPS